MAAIAKVLPPQVGASGRFTAVDLEQIAVNFDRLTEVPRRDRLPDARGRFRTVVLLIGVVLVVAAAAVIASA